MAFLKFAKATIVQPHITSRAWAQVRTAAKAEAAVSENLMSRAAEIFGKAFDPKDYLLTHATIVASVDTYEPSNAKLGSIMEGGIRVNRRYGNYRIKQGCDQYINNNLDAWDREVLLKSYRTFIGGHNFCFAPGTGVLLSDGTYRAIEDIQVGDQVITHTGVAKPVRHIFGRDYTGDIQSIKVDRFAKPIFATGNHPFRAIQVQAPPVTVRGKGKISSRIRYRQDQIARYLRGEGCSLIGQISADKAWTPAASLQVGSYLLGSEHQYGDFAGIDKAVLLGYFLSEGCQMSPHRHGGVVLSFGPHEKILAEDAADRFRRSFGGTVSVLPAQTTLRVHAHGAGVSKWMLEYGGNLAHGKRVPAEVFGWGREALLHLMAAWLAGDGNVHGKTRRMRGSSVSKDLAFQMCRIAEICGLKATVLRTQLQIGEVVSQTRMVVGGEVQSFDVIPRHHVWSVIVSADSTAELLTRSVRWGSPLIAVPRKRADLAWWGGCRAHRVAANVTVPYTGKVYNLEVEDDHSYVVDHGIAVHNCEHVQVEALSKGRIIDAVARDLGDTVYVDILIATERKHADLVTAIETGKMTTLSMGCTVDSTTCTKCGHVAADETEMCGHVKYEKGNTFFDEQGRQHRVAELCFPSGTRLVMGDGCRRVIDDIQIGDVVLSHTGVRRSVTKVFARQYTGDLIALDVTGLPQTLRSTPNHPYWVLSPRSVCACGCGTPLIGVRKNFSVAEYTRRFAPGHHPNGKGESNLKVAGFAFKSASELREGDMLALPVPTTVVHPGDVTENQAWLLGWFLAEGRYIKTNGRKTGVQFTLNADDERVIAEKIASQLRVAFPPEQDARMGQVSDILHVLDTEPATVRDLEKSLGRKPRHLFSTLKHLADLGVATRCKLTADEKTARGLRRKGVVYLWSAVLGANRTVLAKEPHVYCLPRSEGGSKLTVAYNHRGVAAWFEKHAGEYAAEKRISGDAIYWPLALQRELLQGYVCGDGTVDSLDRHHVSSVSDTLISQMQIVAARCGLWTRRQILFDGKCVEFQDVINGSPVPVDSRGWKSLHELHFQPSGPVTDLFGMCGGRERGLSPAWRQHAGYMLYRVRKTAHELYSGQVHNIEVAEDHSYLVEGMAVHNCGHKSLDPTGGVQFVEASWVGTPAFTGAVLRNVLTATPEISAKAAAVLNTPPPEWSQDTRKKAAAVTGGFLAGWDEGGDEGGGEAEGETPAAPAPDKGPFDDLEKELSDHMLDRVRKKIKKDMDRENLDQAAPPANPATNEGLVKEGRQLRMDDLVPQTKRSRYGATLSVLCRTASDDAVLLDRVATLNAEYGVSIPVSVYRAALRLGSLWGYASTAQYLRACQAILGTTPTIAEVKTLIRLGKLISRRGQACQENGTNLAVAKAKESVQ